MSAELEANGDLIGVFQALAAKLGDVHIELRGELAECRRGTIAFAIVGERHAELRLHPEIAEAARRTPSTSPSKRGADWVTFEPPHLDQHALNRAEAWFLSAWRMAGQPAAGREG